MLISCGSQNKTLSQFSKRKYLKKYKPSKCIKDGPINTYAFEQKEAPEALYAAKEIQPEHFVVNEIEAEDFSELVLPQTQQVYPLRMVNRIVLKHQNNRTIYKKYDDLNEVKNQVKKTHPLVILSAVLLLVFLPGAFVVSVIALNKIKKEPEKYKGKGHANFVLFLSLTVMLLFMALFIYMMCCFSVGVGGNIMIF